MEINTLIDHTYLKAFGTKKDIATLIEEAREHAFKSVCVNPVHVPYCAEKLNDSDVLVCTVIGFPLGANTTEVKVYETLNALQNGADEIDMVANIGKIKEHDYDYVLSEVNQVKSACKDHTLKVIIETCYLTDEEIAAVSEVLNGSNADFVKTSTGFGTAGAKVEHVKIMHDHASDKKIKAAGGVRTPEDVHAMVDAGASRIGTSRGVSLVGGKDSSENGGY
jgi:deoxyribose-phosphate aldolase